MNTEITFVAQRLTDARAARRIPSMASLATSMSISASTVSRWENGSSSPDYETLLKLSNKLSVRPEYFLRPTHSDNKPFFFRTLASTRSRDLLYQKSHMRWLLEISNIIEHYVDFPEVNIPDVLNGANYKQLRDEDIEQIALDLRKHWNIGEGPCTDVVGLMEKTGFVVSSIEIGTTKLDGLCGWSPVNERPHVILANDKMSFYRRQMDAAHEMAHGILHKNVTSEEFKKDIKFIESQAFRLASAFLLPSTSYAAESNVQPSLVNLIHLKERWHVSIKAQIKRLQDLKIISKDYAGNLYKLYSAKRWHRKEPLDDTKNPIEPRLLKDALHLIVDNHVRSKADLLGLEFTVSSGDIENLTGLPNGWFSANNAEIVNLKINPNINKQALNSTTSDVVKFPEK